MWRRSADVFVFRVHAGSNFCDAVIAYITHDDRPNISPASSQHGAKRLVLTEAPTAFSRQSVNDEASGKKVKVAHTRLPSV